MAHPAVATVGALASTLAAVLAVCGLAFSHIHGPANVYDGALVLRPEATTFDSVPTGLTHDLAVDLYFDDAGLVLEGSSIDGDRAVFRWTGTAFVPGPDPASGAQRLDEEFEVSLPFEGGVIVTYSHFGAGLAVVAADGSARPVALPTGYEPYTVLAAGPARALVIPDHEETRTFFLDVPSATLTPGPETPPWMSRCMGSTPDGTVFILPGRTVEVTRWHRALPSVFSGGLAVLGFALLGRGFMRGTMPAGGVAAGIGIGIVLFFVLAALLVRALATTTFFI